MQFLRRVSLVVASIHVAAAAVAAEKTFDFKDPKGVNAMTFELDSVLEPIMGLAKGISGEVRLDPANPKATRGRIAVDASSVVCSNQRMTEVLHGGDWLNVAEHGKIEFVIKDVAEVRAIRENAWELTLVGDFMCKGQTRPVTIKAKADYLPGKAGSRLRGAEGDLLVLRAAFEVKRTDFGIKLDQSTDVVADVIQIRASIVGMSK